MTATETRPGELTAALDKIRTDLSDGAAYPHRVMEIHTPRLLAALDETLKLHQPKPVYGLADDGSGEGKSLCSHPFDSDPDAHFEGDDGYRYCRDKIDFHACRSCADEDNAGLWATWPCATHEAISRTLLGGAA